MPAAGLLLLSLAAAVAAASGERNATIGILHRLTATNGPFVHDQPLSDRSLLGAFWDGVSCGAILAIHHANARNGSVVPKMADIKRTFYASVSADTASEALNGITGYRRVLAAGANAVVGAARSAVSQPLAASI